MQLQPVVLTGIGAVTAYGDYSLHGKKPAQANALNAFRIDQYLSTPKTYLDRCSALALAASALALRDSGLNWPVEEEDFGIALGTHLGCIETMRGFWDNIEQKGARLANPLLFSHSYLNSPISLCAIEFGLKGYHATFCADHDSGLEAVRAAYDAIRLGHARAMLCGGVEAKTPARAQFEPQENMGEGAAFFVLQAGSDGLKSRAINEAWFESASAQNDRVRARFGDCGGTHSSLALMLQTLAL